MLWMCELVSEECGVGKWECERRGFIRTVTSRSYSE
jgi:hypothetical protein